MEPEEIRNLPSFKLLYFEAQKKAVFECLPRDKLFIPAILFNGLQNRRLRVTVEVISEEKVVTMEAPVPVTPIEGQEFVAPENYVEIMKNRYLTPEGDIKQYRQSTGRLRSQISKKYVERIYRIIKMVPNEKEAVDKIVELGLSLNTARYYYNLVKRAVPLLEKIFEKPTPKPISPEIKLPEEVQKLIDRKGEEKI